MTKTATNLTYEQIEKLAANARGMKGAYEVRCCGLTVGRYATLSFALTMARKLESQTDAAVTVH